MQKTLIITALFAQIISFGQINNDLMKDGWKPNKEKEIYGNAILRLEGKNDKRGITNIGYRTLKQVLKDIKTLSENEMWTSEKKERELTTHETIAAGGMIDLYITRQTINEANTDVFTVIINDENGKEVFRKVLKDDIPEAPSSANSFWWNYTSIPIKPLLNGKYHIYIIDKLGGDNTKFKFEINN